MNEEASEIGIATLADSQKFWGTERSEAERGFPVRDRTMDQQRLGGAVPGTFSATQAAE
jgi:hypothetical protein